MANELVQQLLSLGREYYQSGEYGKAESYLVQVLKHSRGFADVHNMLGVIYYQQGHYQRARARFEEALKINPRYTDAAINLAVTYNEMGEYEKAGNVYKEAVDVITPTVKGAIDPYVKGKIANMYMELGDAWASQGNLQRSQHEYMQALELCPNFLDIKTKLALSLRDTGDLAKAEKLLIEVIEERPNYHKARIELGLIYFSQDMKEDARQQWDEVLKVDYSNKSARMYMRLLLTKEEENAPNG